MASEFPIKEKVTFYVTRDIERALGKDPVGDYFIITNSTPYAEEIKKKFSSNIFLIKKDRILDTHELLSLNEVIELVNKYDSSVLVFKNTTIIEKICDDNHFNLLNPSAELSEKIENKISQIKWLGSLSSKLPHHQILTLKDVEWNDKVFLIQWAHSHTGDGTILIQNKEILNELKKKFPSREAKVVDFIKGPMFTMNIVVSSNGIFLGNLSYQITGTLPFTENPFSTIGNDWSVPPTILSESQLGEVESLAKIIGEKMRESGWNGLFGIDVIYDEERNILNLIEINARQPASTTYESVLQNKLRAHGVTGITTFEAHIFSLLNYSVPVDIIKINDGAQILQRVTSKTSPEINYSNLTTSGYNVIKYSNTKLNSDLLRIQSDKGLLESHNKFNERGKQIVSMLG